MPFICNIEQYTLIIDIVDILAKIVDINKDVVQIKDNKIQ